MDDQRTHRKDSEIVRATMRLLRLTFLMYAGAEAGLVLQYRLPLPLSSDTEVVAQSLALFLGAFSGLALEWWIRSAGLYSIHVSMRALFVTVTLAALGLGWIIYICRK